MAGGGGGEGGLKDSDGLDNYTLASVYSPSLFGIVCVLCASYLSASTIL